MPLSPECYRSLSLLKKQCFRNHFQDISSNMSPMNTLVQPTVLYGLKVWGPCLLEYDWASAKRVQILFHRIIRCKKKVPHLIILAEFGVQHFRLEIVFCLISLLHCIHCFTNSTKGQNQYPYLAYYSSESIASANHSSRTHC